MKKMLPLLLILSLMACLVPAANAQENALEMEELTVQVMPEFAAPPNESKKSGSPLLVGYHGSLKNNAKDPQKGVIEIALPMEEENFKIGFVADYSSDLSTMNEIEYEIDKKKGTISWTTSEEIQPQELYKFVIEFYTASIKERDSSKVLEYQFENFTEIGLVNLIVVEPLNTDHFKVEPEAESHQKNSYNMNMYIYQSQKMQPGDSKTLKVEYSRTDERTTSEIMEEISGESGSSSDTGAKENETSWWMAGGIGAAAIIAAGLLVFALRKRSSSQKEESSTDAEKDMKKAKVRSMLLEGSITEEEYNELLKKI